MGMLDDPDVILKVRRPLYGLHEDGLHCSKTYHDRHKQMLSMLDSAHDKSLLFTDPNSNTHGIASLQVDDTLVAVDQGFQHLEPKYAEKFYINKPRIPWH